VVIIIALFLVQRLGTGAVGRLFGPIMGVWFTVLGVLGVRCPLPMPSASCSAISRPRSSP